MLERLHGSLLDHIVSMAGAPPRAHVAALRKLAQQLLVGSRVLRVQVLNGGIIEWLVADCMPAAWDCHRKYS